MSENPDKYGDSAGVPWAGRSFQENNYKDDNGEADPRLNLALRDFAGNPENMGEVLDAFGQARVLIPLIANLGEEGASAAGLKTDKSAELSIVTVMAPDGQVALPVFSSVTKMNLWNPQARPVPNNGRAVALAAASEGTTRVVLDAGSDSELVFRRPQLAAIAQGLQWEPPHTNRTVNDLVAEFLSEHKHVESFSLDQGDPTARLLGQELVISLYLEAGLNQETLSEIESTFFRQLGDSEQFVDLVDSVAVRFLPAS